MGYQLIEHIEVGAGGAASIEFTGIPQDGVDLVLVYSARNTGSARYPLITFNNDNATNYDNRQLFGAGSGGGASQYLLRAYLIPFTLTANGYTADTFGSAELYISNYTSSNGKSISHNGVNENNSSLAYQYLSADYWDNSAAINSIQFTAGSGSLEEFSSASLYKVTAD